MAGPENPYPSSFPRGKLHAMARADRKNPPFSVIHDDRDFFAVVVDDREKIPLPIPASPHSELRVRRLATGDYSVSGLEHLIAIERKKPAELLHTVGAGRGRFLKELHRMEVMQFLGGYVAIVIEGSYRDLENLDAIAAANGASRAVKSAHVLAAISAWSVQRKIPVWFGGDVEGCGRLVYRLLLAASKEILGNLSYGETTLTSQRDVLEPSTRHGTSQDEPSIVARAPRERGYEAPEVL